MINMTHIVTAAKNQLNADSEVSAICTVLADEYINEDPSQAPWICVYSGPTRFDPRGVGYNNWEAFPSIRIMVQESSQLSGEECAARLNDTVDKVIRAVLKDITFNDTVDMVNSISTEPRYIETERTSLHFRNMLITIELEADAYE